MKVHKHHLVESALCRLFSAPSGSNKYYIYYASMLCIYLHEYGGKMRCEHWKFSVERAHAQSRMPNATTGYQQLFH